MTELGPVDPAQRRVAERRLLDGLRRLHRREPMRPDVRLDALLAAARSVAPARARGHRGATPLELDDAGLLAVVDELAAEGLLLREGRRVRLPEHRPELEAAMQDRVERLLAGLREAGYDPRATWDELRERVDRLATYGPLTVARVRDHLHTSRRHAEAILARRRADRDRLRRRRTPGASAPRRPRAARPR
jgi:hypothetical protein